MLLRIHSSSTTLMTCGWPGGRRQQRLRLVRGAVVCSEIPVGHRFKLRDVGDVHPSLKYAWYIVRIYLNHIFLSTSVRSCR